MTLEQLLGREISTLHPDIISAILRDPLGTMFPCHIGVNCDECWKVVEGDYIVDESTPKAERLGFARAFLKAQGWEITPEADLCSSCATTHRQEGLS
jgi:hypothetical protein